MATLNIGGKRVTVDDSFLSLPPEQQQQTVDEIASQIGGGQPQPEAVPSPYDSGNAVRLTGGPGVATPPMRNDLMTSATATVGGIVNGIPVLGPLAQNATDNIMGIGSQLTGGDYGKTVQGLRDRRAQIAQAAPVADLAGNVVGGIAGWGKLAQMAPEAVGIAGNLLQRMGNSAATAGTVSALDSAARGGDVSDMVVEGGAGALMGGAIPGIGAGLKAAARPITRPVSDAVRGLLNPKGEAGKAVGSALSRDRANPVARPLSDADEATARTNGQPLLNVDRGGETTRALMRSAANQNPEARSIVEKLAEDRFRSQELRTTGFFRRAFGGDVSDLARKAQIKAQSQPANRVAYDRAMNSTEARAVWTPEIRQLMQSDSFRTAINAAEKRGTDVAAAQGFKAVRNPFVFGQDGSISLRKMPDGSTALPSLQFWDQVKRELDSKIGIAKRAGDNTTFADLTALKQALVRNLDAAVPSYQQARGTAAAFFDAEDAVDAGRKAFASPKAIDESLAAINAMTKAEKDDFALGMVSQMMDDVRAVNNRANLTRMFDVSARKELMEAALGPAKAKQFEAFIRVEDIMDKVRGSLGNSTTARQLVELGIVGELRNTGGAGGLGGMAGFAASGGNLSTAATVAMLTAAGRVGLRAVQGKANAQVLQKVAEMLASGDEREISRAIANAQLSQQHMVALEAIQKGIGVVARGAAFSPGLLPAN